MPSSNYVNESGESCTPKQESLSPTPCVRLSSLSRDGARSAFTPYKPTTVLTNLQRGNVQTQTPSVLPERSIHQLAAQGELFLQNLEDGVALDEQDENGFTPLMWAAAYGQLATVRLLLELGASVSIFGKYKETALLFASASGHAAIVKELIKHKANIDEKDEDGNTALMYAAYNNHAVCVHELLNCGADMTLENDTFETVYDIAISKRCKAVQAVVEKHMMNLLVDPK